VTRLYEDMGDENPHPDRKALQNFTWTDEAINDWEEIWHDLWLLGYKWEWQNSDRYARRYGDKFNLFACHNDAVRLDMAVPLPGLEVIFNLAETVWSGGASQRRSQLYDKLRAWLTEHYKG
jgi:hypothetical protein